MKPSFVPFAPPSGTPGQAIPDSFQLTVLPQSSQAVPFIPSTPTTTHACAVAGPGSATPSNPTPSAGSEGPEVTYERDGDRVTRIRIRCGCGQILDLNLAY
jgi:hypothetical protein